MIKKILISLMVLFMFQSCKKTKLEGDLSVLIGKWKYKYTIALSNSCVSYFGGPYITNDESTIGYEYFMTFLEKGKVLIRKGNNEKKYRLIYDPDVKFSDSDTAFAFSLSKHKKGISVYYRRRSGIEYIETPDLPEGTRDNCEYRISVFEKTE